MKTYPALDVLTGPADIIPAIVEDFSATAIEERHGSVRVFFSTADARAAARKALTARGYAVDALDVDDEDWARRSQADLTPVTVGRVMVVPTESSVTSYLSPVDSRQSTVTVVIRPSMGFGTGHHATTRLCLAALQAVDLVGRSVLDVGTGSGVLAIAAACLGAAHVVGVDNDADAIQSATENLALNPEARDVEFRVADLTEVTLPLADVVTANLTGALLARTSQILLAAVQPGGTLIASGTLTEERDAVLRAFAGAGGAGPNRVRPTSGGPTDVGRTLSGPPVIWEQQEAGWVAMVLKKP